MSAKTILVVDDDQGLRITTTAILEDAGYVVLEAEDGNRAVEIVSGRDDVDLVLSDIRMPRLNGVDAFRKIRGLRPQLPVILMTGFSVEQLISEAQQEGVFTVIHKPFDIGAALQVIESALARPWILIVDDTDEHREALKQSLASRQLQALDVSDFEAAFEALAAKTVDVAVVDVELAEQGELARVDDLARKHRGLKVIVTSGRDAVEMIRKTSWHGCTAILQKPVDAKSLVRLIAELRAQGT